MREHRPSFQTEEPERGPIVRLATFLFGTAEQRLKAREKRELAKAGKAMDRAVDARRRADELKRQ